MFKKIREGFEKIASEMYKQSMADSDEILNELCDRLRQIGITGVAHLPENMWDSMGRGLIGNVMRFVKIEGKNIDTIQVEVEQHHIRDDERILGTFLVYYYHYVVQLRVQGLEGLLKAEVKPIKKGLLSRDVIDFRWEGGELAQRLNGDTELRNVLLRGGLNQLPIIEVMTHEKPRRVPGIGKPPKEFFDAQEAFKQCVRITKRPRMPSFQKFIGVGVQEPTRVGVELPTRESFESYDRIAHHVHSIIDSRS